MIASPVPFSNSQTPMSSSSKSTTFHPITPFSDFTVGFVSREKKKNYTLETSNSSNVDTYIIDSAHVKLKFINLKNEILKILGGDITVKYCVTMKLISLNRDVRICLQNQTPGLMIKLNIYKKSSNQRIKQGKPLVLSLRLNCWNIVQVNKNAKYQPVLLAY